MNKIKKSKILIYIIIAVLIIAGIISIYFNKLNYTLMYSDNTRIDIYIGKDYNMKDIEQIAKEVFQKQEIKYQKVETFNDTVALTVKQASEEQINLLKEKVKTKYELETTDNLVTTSNVGHVKGRDIVKPYIVPVAIATLAILIYTSIRYIKLGMFKTIYNLLLKLILIEAIYLSIIAIFRLPIGIYTMPIAIALYLIVIMSVIINYQNKLEQKKSEEIEKINKI